MDPQGEYVNEYGFWEMDSTSSPNTHILLPSGISMFGVDEWVTKLANVA